MQQADTLINKFEKAGIFAVLLVIVIRIWLGPETNFMLLVTTTILSIYYLWFGFFIFNRYKLTDLLDKSVVQQIKPLHVYTGIIMGVIISYTLIAILFGFFFFPFTPFLLATSFVILVAFTMFLAVFQIVKKKRIRLFWRFYYRAVLFAIIAGLLWLTPLETRLNFLFKDHKDFIEAYLYYTANPDDEKALERLRDERSRFR